MGFPLDLLFEGPASTGGASAFPRRVFLFAVLFLASIISSSDVYNITTTAAPGDPSYATTDVASANATSSTHTGAVSTAVTSSIGAEVVEEFGCADTEFRLTCRELDSTIAILDARFHPFDGAINIDPVISMRSNSSSANDTVVTDGETADGNPCPAPKEWAEEEQWARVVGPDGGAVVDPSAENDSSPWPLQPGPAEYHFRLALNHRCSGVNHCSFILASDFEEAGRSWGPGAVRIRYACMRHGHHVVRYCNENIVAGATTSKKSGDQWRRRERRRRGRGRGGAAASKRSTGEREGDGVKEGIEEGNTEEEGGEGWMEGEGFIASPGYPKYYIGGGPIGGDGERKACEWMIRPRQPGQRVQVTLLDVSLRGIAPLEQGCSDWVEVTAVPEDTGSGGETEGGEERVLLTGCGEAPEAVKIESPEDAPGIRVALLSNSGALFPKRGILFHYKALGCRWPPPSPPKDGYLVSRNSTVAQYMCCVGFKFPDSGLRERELHCDEQRGLWRVHAPNHKHFPHKLLIPDCTDGDTSLWAGNGTKKAISYLNENSTFSDKTAMLKDTDLMLDVLIPAIIIAVLLLGNGVILYVIFHFKKRKQSTEVQEEELRISQNGLDTTTGRPSDV